MAARICPQCRTRVDERRAKTSPYCLSCGAPLGTGGTGFGKPPAKGSALPWILAGIGVLALLGLGVVIVLVVAVSNAEPDDEPPVAVAVGLESGPRLELPSATSSVPAVKPPPTVKATGSPPSAPPTIIRPPPSLTIPTPPPTSSVTLGAFPRARATNELDRVTTTLASCKRSGDPTGFGSIRVDFEPDGRVTTLIRSPFAGTLAGSCIAQRFRAINIGKFTGTTQPIERTFTLPP